MYYYGDFYTLSGVPCRSVLEIVVEERIGRELGNLSSCSPDVVVVMANPGSSAPQSNGNGSERAPSAIGSSVDLVATVPDRSQMQLKAVMDHMGYAHVRVLNLSDVREKSLEKLAEQLNCEDVGDSVFACSARSGELTQKLRSHSRIVVAAWSYESAAPLTKRGKAAYNEILDRGYSLIGSGGRFAHPSRKGSDWVNDLVPKLQAGAAD